MLADIPSSFISAAPAFTPPTDGPFCVHLRVTGVLDADAFIAVTDRGRVFGPFPTAEEATGFAASATHALLGTGLVSGVITDVLPAEAGDLTQVVRACLGPRAAVTG
jgi:hypothetical protein